jgi:hypothetical protein
VNHVHLVRGCSCIRGRKGEHQPSIITNINRCSVIGGGGESRESRAFSKGMQLY